MYDCMAEGEDFFCHNKATIFTVLGSSIFMCWCDEHWTPWWNRSAKSGLRPWAQPLVREHEVPREEWEALQAMQEIHGT